jgi:hypothetical protein
MIEYLGDLNKIRWNAKTEQVEQVILDSESDPIQLVFDGESLQIQTKDISYLSLDFETLERLNYFLEQAETLYNSKYEKQD